MAGECNSGLDGLAETNLVGKNGASGKWRPEGKERGLNLVGIEVNLGICQSRCKTIYRRRAGPLGQLVSEIAGMVGRQFHLSCKAHNNNKLRPSSRQLTRRGCPPKTFRIRESMSLTMINEGWRLKLPVRVENTGRVNIVRYYSLPPAVRLRSSSSRRDRSNSSAISFSSGRTVWYSAARILLGRLSRA